MTTYKAGDTLPAEDITDDLIGAEVKTAPVNGISASLTLSRYSDQMGEKISLASSENGSWWVHRGTLVTVVTPPPVKAVQPEEPTALGTLVKIEGLDWTAVLADRGGEGDDPFYILDVREGPEWCSWSHIHQFAAGRQIVVSSAPEFPEAEPPETITEWPEDDDTALRGWAWKDREDDRWEYREGRWSFLRNDSMWSQSNWSHPSRYLPLTRVERA